jgi:hypothetical protein
MSCALSMLFTFGNSCLVACSATVVKSDADSQSTKVMKVAPTTFLTDSGKLADRITAWRMVTSSHRAEKIVMQNVQPRIRFILRYRRLHRDREEDSVILSTRTPINGDRCRVIQKNKDNIWRSSTITPRFTVARPLKRRCRAILVLHHRPCIKWYCLSKEAD